MRDKVQKIREEVARIQLYTQSNVLKQILDYIDSLQEEPVSEDLEKIIEEIAEPTILNAYGTKELARRLRNTICDTSVSEDLEKAEKEWLTPQLDKSYADYGETKMMELTRFDGYAMLDAIEFGAKWQKEQDNETIELAEDHAMLAGMEKMKEQMMKDAVETSVCALIDGLHVIIEPKYLKEYRFGEKVKVIVIKED